MEDGGSISYLKACMGFSGFVYIIQSIFCSTDSTLNRTLLRLNQLIDTLSVLFQQNAIPGIMEKGLFKHLEHLVNYTLFYRSIIFLVFLGLFLEAQCVV